MDLPKAEVSSTNVRLRIETKVESEHSFSHKDPEHVFTKTSLHQIIFIP